MQFWQGIEHTKFFGFCSPFFIYIRKQAGQIPIARPLLTALNNLALLYATYFPGSILHMSHVGQNEGIYISVKYYNK